LSGFAVGTGCFVTGTDTGVGKTLVACALLRAFAARGLRVVGMKPVAAGATMADDGWRNEDVAALAEASNVRAAREWTNPYLLAAPVAPHVAAAAEGVAIDLARIERSLAHLRAVADITVVEGVGGFRVPLNEREDSADLAARLALPVVLVVGMRLGCLNHALLTAEAIGARDLRLAAWVANRIDPGMARAAENVAALSERLGAPLIGDIPFMRAPRAAEAASALQVGGLLERLPLPGGGERSPS
jgi:dethiobiotin synthetase